MERSSSLPSCSSMLLICILFIFGCSSEEMNNTLDMSGNPIEVEEDIEEDTVDEDDTNEEVESSFADIDFSNWKVTLPIDEDNNGNPDEYQPDELVNFGYQTNTAIQPYMFDDTSDTSLVFYTTPGVSTTNSSYSRTELRELIDPSTSRVNWTLEEGGVLEGRLKIDNISEDLVDTSRDYHRTILMQIHGIISQEDMDIHGFTSNNGPPLIKMYWKDGFIWSHKKSLVDEFTEGTALLEVYNNTWTDVKDNMGFVGYEPFELRITASDARLEIVLNDGQPLIYEDVSLEKWPFENYFKAGNYLQSAEEDAFATIKYYNLEITH